MLWIGLQYKGGVKMTETRGFDHGFDYAFEHRKEVMRNKCSARTPSTIERHCLNDRKRGRRIEIWNCFDHLEAEPRWSKGGSKGSLLNILPRVVHGSGLTRPPQAQSVSGQVWAKILKPELNHEANFYGPELFRLGLSTTPQPEIMHKIILKIN